MNISHENLSILIVDDEKKACSILKNILVKYVTIPVANISVAYNTKEAEGHILKHAPDVVFLDIEMPNENAFMFLERIYPFNFEVIFVTAFDAYAIKAFRLNAVDYLLKPVSIAELKNAMVKLYERLKYKNLTVEPNVQYRELSLEVQNKVASNKIILRDKNNTEVIHFQNILFIEADGSYSKIQFIKDGVVKEITMSWLLTDYEELLPTNQFFRIHRSYLINCLYVVKIVNDEANYVLLNNNFKLLVSRRNYSSFLNFLKGNNYNYE